MNKLKYFTAIAAVMGALTMSAKADLILSPFGDIPKNCTGINGGNSEPSEQLLPLAKLHRGESDVWQPRYPDPCWR